MNSRATDPVDTDPVPPSRRVPVRAWATPWMRRSLIGLGVMVVVVGALEWSEWPFLRAPLESMLQQSLKRDVSIGEDFGVRFIGPLRVRTDRLVIGAAPNGPILPDGQNSELVRASEVRLALPWSTVFGLARGNPEKVDADPKNRRALQKRPYFSRLEVARLDATLLRDADGRANWQFSTDEKDSAPLVLPEFGYLAVKTGEIRFEDAVVRTKFVATVRTLEVAGSGAGSAATPGLELTARGSHRDQPLSVNLRASGVLPLAVSTAETPPVPIHLEARVGDAELDFDGTASDALKLGGLDGNFRVAGPSLAAVGDVVGVTLPTTAAFSMQGRARKEGAAWSAAIATLSVGTSRLRGNFRYDPTPGVPKLTGDLSGGRLSLPDLGPAFGAQPRPRSGAEPARAKAVVAARADAARQGDAGAPRRILPQREFDLPSLAAMDADVAIALDQVDLGTPALEPFAPLKAQLILDKQTLTLKDVVAKTASGEVRGQLAVDAREKTPRWSAELRVSGVQLDRFIKARDRADRSAEQGYVSGSLGGSAKVRGRGRSTAEVLSTLDGEAQLWVREGAISHLIIELAGLDVAEALGMLMRGDDRLPMRCAVAGLKIEGGEISPQIAVIETSDSTLTIEGGVSLAKESLGLVFRAQPKDRSPLTLRSPVYLEGSFTDPQVRLDAASVGMRIAAAAALAVVTPFAALLALVDLGEPEKQVCAEAMQGVRRSATAAKPPAGRP